MTVNAGYVATWKRALRTFQKHGSAVVFRSNPFASTTSSTVAGYLIQDASDPQEYARLGLTSKDNQTTIFRPNTFGDVPQLGWTVEWRNKTYSVAGVGETNPDGQGAIVVSVILSRATES
jgi:hypothetical protein